MPSVLHGTGPVTPSVRSDATEDFSMTIASDPAAAPAATVEAGSFIHWGSVLAGALVATAVWLALMTFGAAMGLSMSSPSPTWRNATVGLALLSGVYILVVGVGAYALGGYIAGRMRRRLAPATSDEIDFRDGMHGATAWAVATILGAVLVMAQANMAGPALVEREGGGAAITQGSGSEPRVVSYEVDRLLRGDPTRDAGDIAAIRAETGRLLMAALDERTFLPEDRTYLIGLVSATSGLEPEAAQRRVDTVVAQTRERANRARRSLVLTAFMAAAALAVGFAAAWFAAGIGGRHRDERAPALIFGGARTATLP